MPGIAGVSVFNVNQDSAGGDGSGKFAIESSTAAKAAFAAAIAASRYKSTYRQLDQNRRRNLEIHRHGRSRVRGGDLGRLAKTAQASDAAFEVLTDDISIAELQTVITVHPTAYGPHADGFAGFYVIIEIQPKGTAWPPDRAYVLLRKV